MFSNTVGRTAYRGPWQFESVAREVLLDIAARRMGIDPVELRRRNMLRADELPYTNAHGMPYDDMSPAETFEQALEMLDYDDVPAPAGRGARDEGRYLGVGHVHATSSRPRQATATTAARGRPSASIRPAR